MAKKSAKPKKAPKAPKSKIPDAPKDDIIDASEIEEAAPPSNEALASIADLAKTLQERAAKVAHLQAELKLAEREYIAVSQEQLPKAMNEVGLKSFTLADGSELSITTEYFPNISAANKEAAFKWLKETKNDGIIKRTIKLDFGKGDNALAEKFLKSIKATVKKKAKLSDTTAVHAGTLRAFVRDLIGRNIEPPPSFGVFTITQAVLTNPTGGSPVQTKDEEL